MSGPGAWDAGFSLGFGPQSIVSVLGLPTDCMQVLGYSSTQKLFYDEPNTQAFYLLTLAQDFITDENGNVITTEDGVPLALETPSVLSLYRVSPAFARNWLVFSGLASNWVYNPFGTATFSTFSNVV